MLSVPACLTQAGFPPARSGNYEKHPVPETEYHIVAVAELTCLHIVAAVSRGGFDRDSAGRKHAQTLLNFHEHSIKHIAHLIPPLNVPSHFL